MKTLPTLAAALTLALPAHLLAEQPTEMAAAELTPICDTPTQAGDKSCYLALQTPQDCYVWNPRPQTNETATWSGQCQNRLPDGPGTITWRWPGAATTDTGTYTNGKRHGPWTLRHANGDISEGEYRDGEMHGVWRVRKGE